MGAVIAYVLVSFMSYKAWPACSHWRDRVIGCCVGWPLGLVVGLSAGAILGWCAYWLHLGRYRASLPPYATAGQVLWHNAFKFICGAIFFFLIAPIITIIPLSFNAQNFFTFTPEMLSLDPAGYSLKHYKTSLPTPIGCGR